MKPTTARALLITTLFATTTACEERPHSRPPAPIGTTTQASATKAPELTPPVLPAPKPPATPPAVGMVDPFKLMNTAGARSLDLAWKAARKRRYTEARAGFAGVVAAYPDKTATRFAELRMAALEGDFPSVPELWKQLLARDYLGYARRLDSDKEMAPLRRSPEWATIQAITAEAKLAHARGLSEGVFFVARVRGAGRPQFGPDLGDGVGALAKLDLDQEAYHFDGTTGRFRRLSDSGGKVVAIHHDSDKRQLMLLTAEGLKKQDKQLGFHQPAVTVLSLDTLEKLGPLPIKSGKQVSADSAAEVKLCFSDKGEPLWLTSSLTDPTGARAYTFDATGTGLVATDEGCGEGAAVTSARPAGVKHQRPSPEGVALSDDGLSLDGVDEELPVRATSAIQPGTFGWSPGKKRFAYMDMDGVESDSCQDNLGLETSPPASALYVWDATRKRARRISKASSSFTAQWLDDDRLAYEVGKGAVKKLGIAIHDLAAGGTTITLATPAGAGLFGLPSLDCAQGDHHALVM